DAELSRALSAETAARRRMLPDAAGVLAIAQGPLERLWERERDIDLLRVRLGLTDVAAEVGIRSGGRVDSAGVLRAVPAVLDLAHGPLGLVGPRDTIRGVARWLVAQLAVLTSSADVRIELCADDDG